MQPNRYPHTPDDDAAEAASKQGPWGFVEPRDTNKSPEGTAQVIPPSRPVLGEVQPEPQLQAVGQQPEQGLTAAPQGPELPPAA